MAMKKLKFGWKIMSSHYNKNGDQNPMSVCSEKKLQGLRKYFFLHFIKIYTLFSDVSEKIKILGK